MYSENFIKLLTSPFPVMLQNVFAWRVLKVKLGTQRHFKGIWAPKHLRYLGNGRALGHSKVTQAHGCLGSRGTLFSTHIESIRSMYHKYYHHYWCNQNPIKYLRCNILWKELKNSKHMVCLTGFWIFHWSYAKYK